MKKSAKKALRLVEDYLVESLEMDGAEFEDAKRRHLYQLAAGIYSQTTATRAALQYVRELLGKCPEYSRA